jgi:HEAT repeat protein
MAESPARGTADYLYSLADRDEYAELIRHIRDHSDQNVRYGASGILVESAEEFAEAVTPEIQHALINCVLAEPSNTVRANVLTVLFTVDESTFDTIITRLEANPEATPTDTPYPLILTKWQSSDRWALRYLAIVGFSRVRSQSTISKLRTALERETDYRVVKRAIDAAGTVGDETFVSPIQEYLRADGSEFHQSVSDEQLESVREAAVESLVEIGTDAAYEALVSASRSTDDDLKAHVISEIGRFGAQETVDLVVDKLDDDDNETVREEAAAGVITTFMETDFDEGGAVRQEAIEKMAEEVSTDVSAEFATIVEESPRKTEQRNAAWLLGQLETSTPEAIDTLVETLDDEDDNLRKIASASLTKLDQADVEDKIDAFLESVDEDSEAHTLASFVRSALYSGEDAKKEMIEYTRVDDPSDYTSSE